MRSISPLLALVCLTAALSAQTSQAVLAASKDNTLYEDAQGAVSNAKGQWFFAGQTFGGKRDRACIAFDVAAGVPKGSTIVSAKLTLNMDKTIAGPASIGLHRLQADWGEGTSAALGNEGGGAPATTGDATWRHRFYSATGWTNAGGDFQAAASATLTVDMVGSYTWGSTAAMVADVQAWLDTPATNYGWLLLGPETGTSAKRFGSRENATAASRPALVIDYTPPAASVTPVGAGCAGSNNQVLQHGTSSLPTVPNPAFAWTASQAPASIVTINVWAVGLQQPPLPITPRCSLNINPFTIAITQAALTSPQGQASYPQPIPNVAGLIGVQVDTQVLGFDKGAPGGIISSNGLRALLGK